MTELRCKSMSPEGVRCEGVVQHGGMHWSSRTRDYARWTDASMVSANGAPAMFVELSGRCFRMTIPQALLVYILPQYPAVDPAFDPDRDVTGINVYERRFERVCQLRRGTWLYEELP